MADFFKLRHQFSDICLFVCFTCLFYLFQFNQVISVSLFQAVEFNNPTDLLQKSFSRFKSMFEMMKSTPRGASINEDPVSVDRPTSSFRMTTSPRLSSSRLQSATPQTPSPSPMGELSPLKDSDVYDEDDAVLEQ